MVAQDELLKEEALVDRHASTDQRRAPKEQSHSNETDTRSVSVNSTSALQTTNSPPKDLSSPSSVTMLPRRMSPVLVTQDFENQSSPKLQTLLEGREQNIVHQVTPEKTKVASPESTIISWTNNPPPLRSDSWTEQPATDFQIRGPTYNQDGIKVNSEPSVLKLWAVDLVQAKEPLWKTGLCRLPEERVQRALRNERGNSVGSSDMPAFAFAVNLILPAKTGNFYHWVAYFGIDDVAALRDDKTPFGRVAKPFFFGTGDAEKDHAYRNDIFKLIPRVAEGNFAVRKAVGGKPTLLGRKLKQYFLSDDSTSSSNHNPRFLEVIIDVSSNAVAHRIVKLALGAAKTLAIDLMFLLEGGNTEADGNKRGEHVDPRQNTLPERMLGGVRMKFMDFAQDAQRMVDATTS